MKEFFAPAPWRMGLPEGLSGVTGGIVFPSGIPAHTLERRNLDDYSHLTRRLFDPQLYLLPLNPHRARKTCANLLSYPYWPGVEGDVYDSDALTQAEFRRLLEEQAPARWPSGPPVGHERIRVIESAVRFQYELGCEVIILPSPLTTSPTTDYAIE